jgi:hypothetical protein
VTLTPGRHAILFRYDQAGRGHLVLRRHDAPEPRMRTPLSMRWYDDAAVLPFDVQPEPLLPEWFRFVSAPGTRAIRVAARGRVEAWLDGRLMIDRGAGRFETAQVPAHAPVVALRVAPEPGWSGGAALPEPIVVETDGSGRLSPGDWSKVGILHNYSGGVRYRRDFSLTAQEAAASMEMDLGGVCATAEVILNGTRVGVRVAPPWRFELTGNLRAGDNTVEVLVFNTLANHYQTVPSLYRGEPVSGLLGPIRLMSRDDAVNGVANAARRTTRGRD